MQIQSQSQSGAGRPTLSAWQDSFHATLDRPAVPIDPFEHPALAARLEAIGARHGFGQAAAHTFASALREGGGGMAQFSHPELGGSGQWMRGGMVMIGDMFNRELAGRVNALGSELADWLENLPREPQAGRAASATADEAQGLIAKLAELHARGVLSDAEFTTKKTQLEKETRMEPMKPMAPMKPMKPMDPPSSDWWPEGLSNPSSSGSQNGLKYAFFPDQQRLAIEQDGKVTQYDTGDHKISGVSQQQGGGGAGGMPKFSSQKGDVDLSSLKKVD